MYFVYIVECSDGSFYTGIAKDLDKRINEHNSSSLGAKYTKGRRPVELVYFIRKKNRASATSEEYRIKQLRREEKLLLIKSKKQPR